MRINVSAVKAFQHDQLDWYYRYHLRRVPRSVPKAYFSVGSVWHIAMASPPLIRLETFLNAASDMRKAWLDFQDSDKELIKFSDECDRLAALLTHYTERFTPDETLLIEQPLEYSLSTNRPQDIPITLIGRPDRVIKLHGKYWNVQHRTLSDRTPIPLYLATRERDLHELAYAALITHHFKIDRSQYGGTYMNIVRKLSTKAICERPLSAFVQELIPISWDQVNLALRDIVVTAYMMDGIINHNNAIIHNREADLGRFGNTLNPYYEARIGRISITDDAHFMTVADPYATEDPDAPQD